MKLLEACETLSAISQPARLRVFRALIREGQEGIIAGDLARRLDLPKPTLSFHLKELSQAGLIASEKTGRTITYRIRQERVRQLMSFLLDDCCQGRPELCLPKSGARTCGTTNC